MFLSYSYLKHSNHRVRFRSLGNPDAIEAELAHADTNQVRRIYHRALYWEERVRMADWWADEVLAMAQAR